MNNTPWAGHNTPWVGDFTPWVRHFEWNRELQRAAPFDQTVECRLDLRQRKAFIRSFQRFELGESGDGAHLLAKAGRAGDPQYTRALALLVAEEQRHSALFSRGLDHLGGASLPGHWSDTAFTVARRAFGLRTELGLFLVAESVAVDYFAALATAAPDPVLRAIGRSIETDERNHLRFQVDRLAQAFATTPAPLRRAVRLALLVIGAAATAVLVVDHRAALRACGRGPVGCARRAMRQLRRHLDQALGAEPHPLGPLLDPLPSRSGAAERAVVTPNRPSS